MEKPDRGSELAIDHVSIAGSDLMALQRDFAAAGMATQYGGPHSGGQTHMSLLGFRDGSYIELISTVNPAVKGAIWEKHISGDGGPCAWCVRSDDIARDVARAKSMGITARGPEDYTRERPDGVLVEWELGFLGEGEPGSTLPFMIKDKTPRSYRVVPSPRVSAGDSPLIGLTGVVLAVGDIEAAVSLFRGYYDWPAPSRAEGFLPGAELAWFRDTPVVLAAPKGDGWLKDRLAKFGPSPAAFLIQSTDLAKAVTRYPLGTRRPWLDGKELAWVEVLEKRGTLLGVLSP